MAVWVLKAIGLLWFVGAFVVIRQSRLELVIDDATSKIEKIEADLSSEFDALSRPADRARAYWLLVGGVLTLLSGIGLMASHRYVVVPLTLLVLHQGVYAWRQNWRSKNATDAETAETEAMSPQAQNGALSALVVWIAAGILFYRGVLS